MSESYELTTHRTSVKKPNAIMEIEYFDLPQDCVIETLNAFYDRRLEELAVRVGGKLLSTTVAKIGKYDAKEFSIDARKAGERLFTHGRIVLVDKRLFYILMHCRQVETGRLMVDALRGHSLELLAWCFTAENKKPNVIDFLNSFELLSDSPKYILAQEVPIFSRPAAVKKQVEEVKWINGIWVSAARSQAKKQEMLFFATKGMVTWMNDTGKELDGDYAVSENIIEMKFADTVTGTRKVFLLASDDKKKLSSDMGINYIRQ